MIFDDEFGTHFFVGIVHGVDAEVINNRVEQVVIGVDEALVVGVFEVEIAVIEAIKMTELVDNFVADAADGDWFHFKEAIFKTSDLSEVVDLADGTLGNIYNLVPGTRKFSGVLVIKIH